jgi:hypothetical protein
MSTGSVSAASILNAAQSPTLSFNPAKHRKHPSMANPQTQSSSKPTPPAASGQPGSTLNITA